MRILTASLPAILLLVLVAPAHAAEAGCAQAAPCPLTISVDETGFTDGSSTDVTQGDWYEIDFANEGEVNHTITLDGYGLSVTLGVLVDDTATKTVQFGTAGCFAMKDMPSGATRQVRVFVNDHIDVSQSQTSENPCTGSPAGGGGASGTKARAPGLELPLVLVAICLAALAVQRRP